MNGTPSKQQTELRHRTLRPGLLVCAAFLVLCSPGMSQQHADAMGSVATRDARVTGGLEVQGDTARLLTNVSLTANDHDAPVTLNRGGRVLVCSTSEFHLLHSGMGGALIFGLDRGAVEIHTESRPQDAVLTPDLKLVPVTKGALDLRVRVTREGDTCIDNAGTSSPVLNVTDPFSSANYRILPGQHLLFVKGDLHKVVDHERSSCGCPPVVAPRVLAGKPGQPANAEQAAAAHPFPQAQSEGLAPATAASNAAPAGTPSSQVSTTFSYGEGQGRPPSVGDPPSTGATAVAPAAGQVPASQGGFFHSIGRFFHRLFGGSKDQSPSDR